MTSRSRAGWLTVTVLALAVAALSARYLTLDPETFLPEQRAVYLAHLVPLALHVGGAVGALVLGPWQFLPRLRARRPLLHRLTGRLYALCAVATAVGGLLLAPSGLYPPLAPLGFAVLAVLVLVTTVAAVVTARRRDLVRHRVWATRSYALIFTGVTFRLWLVLLGAAGLPFGPVYVTGAWASWLIDLVVAERLIATFRRDKGRIAARGA
ncbi:DUF2306 domain-containing protein [Kitasatospora sp. NPDC048365]|uniref:DUF2306 domain-containing protein n=1 Tax=Kitasatospora sp. NPDC048365 TaxID=3364050 RepID=UPI0037222870